MPPFFCVAIFCIDAAHQRGTREHDQTFQGLGHHCSCPWVHAGAISGAGATELQSGAASWYGLGFHGKRTASGETFNTNALTAAHKSLPFGTEVRVTNERTGRSVVVRINDRGPYAHGRVIDLSKGAAEAVGLSGVGQLTLAKL